MKNIKNILNQLVSWFLENDLIVYKYLFLIGALLNFGGDSFWTMIGFSVMCGQFLNIKRNSRS